MKLRLFTWNLHGNLTALDLALTYLDSQAEGYIAAFQELAGRGRDASAPLQPAQLAHRLSSRPGSRARLISMSEDHRQALIASAPIDQHHRRSGHRIVGVRLRDVGAGWSQLAVLGVHARSHLFADREVDRTHHVASLREELFQFWRSRELAAHYNGLRILDQLGATTLKVRGRGKLSDHFPVEVLLDLTGVKACQIS